MLGQGGHEVCDSSWAVRDGQTAGVQGPRGCCSENAALWPVCFDRWTPSSVTNGPRVQVILSLTYPAFIKENFVSSHVLLAEDLHLEMQASIRDDVILNRADGYLAKSK